MFRSAITLLGIWKPSITSFICGSEMLGDQRATKESNALGRQNCELCFFIKPSWMIRVFCDDICVKMHVTKENKSLLLPCCHKLGYTLYMKLSFVQTKPSLSQKGPLILLAFQGYIFSVLPWCYWQQHAVWFIRRVIFQLYRAANKGKEKWFYVLWTLLTWDELRGHLTLGLDCICKGSSWVQSWTEPGRNWSLPPISTQSMETQAFPHSCTHIIDLIWPCGMWMPWPEWLEVTASFHARSEPKLIPTSDPLHHPLYLL